jgi:HSP20 family protein
MAFFSDPFDDLLRLQSRLDSLLRTPAQPFSGPSGPGGYPPVNVFRGKDGIVLRAELPGFAPEDVNVTCEGRRLTISGERKASTEERGGYHRRERPWGKFSRTFVLPDDLDAERASAQVRHGVLTLRVPLAEAAKPRQITIHAA